MTIAEVRTSSGLPVPIGWYVMAFSRELGVGDVVPQHAVGRNLVVWRDAEGAAHVQDATCPHLGANLGFGGRVDGTDLVCPFHGWHWNGEGSNTNIPYSERVNRSCRLGTYRVIERNGLVMAWYHPHGDDPTWEIPVCPEFDADDESYVHMGDYEFPVQAHWQEVAENGADSAHFGFVHGQGSVPTSHSFEVDGPRSITRSTQNWPLPDGDIEGLVVAESHGPGFSRVRMTGGAELVTLGCNTPIDENRCLVRFSFVLKDLGRPDINELVGRAFTDTLCEQIREDTRIWDHKTFLPRPALADTDGPIMRFRRWADQFYAPPSEGNLGCEGGGRWHRPTVVRRQRDQPI